MTPIKILFVGDARGDVGSLIKKLEFVNKKSGPFSAAFVVGALLDSTSKANGIPASEAPLPIYFLGSGELHECMGGLHACIYLPPCEPVCWDLTSSYRDWRDPP